MKVGNKVKVIDKKNGFNGFRLDTNKCCTKNIGKIGIITEIKTDSFFNFDLVQVFFENGYNVFLEDNTEEGESKGTWFLLCELKRVR